MRDDDAKRDASLVRMREALREIATIEPDPPQASASTMAVLFQYNAALMKAKAIAADAISEGDAP